MQSSEGTVKEPTLKEGHSLAIRIWHWCTFITIFGSLVTVLIAKTIFSTRATIPVVQQALQKSNITASPDQAKPVAHDFNDILWHWHTYIGYVLAALFGFRILIEFFQPKEQKLIPALKNTIRFKKAGKGNNKEAMHVLVVKCLYLFFYFSLLVQAASGLFMVYSDDVDSLKNIRHSVKEIHSAFMWVIIGYIVLHLGGVLLAELGPKYKGIVSDMINGGGPKD